MTGLLHEYESHLRNRKDASEHTISAYLRDVVKFLEYSQQQGVSVKEITPRMVGEYSNQLLQNGKSPATVTRAISSLKSFYKYLWESGAVEKNPVDEVDFVKVERRLPHILTGAEVELFLKQPDSSDVKGCRDRAMLELLYATGIRVSELVALNVSSLDLNEGVIYCGEQRKQRSIPLYPEAIQALNQYLKRSRPQLIRYANESALFVNMKGERMSRQGFWKLIKYYREKAGIETEITPHTLRHSFAAHLLENGADIHVIQEIMGHSDVSSTHVYSKLLNQKTKELYKKSYPET